MSKKPTLATLKSFVRKNSGNLLIKCKSNFDGMTDCVEQNHNASFRPLVKKERDPNRPFVSDDESNTLGFGVGSGVWLVKDIRDYITEISKDGLFGYEVYNCCGCFEIVVKLEQAKEAA